MSSMSSRGDGEQYVLQVVRWFRPYERNLDANAEVLFEMFRPMPLHKEADALSPNLNIWFSSVSSIA